MSDPAAKPADQFEGDFPDVDDVEEINHVTGTDDKSYEDLVNESVKAVTRDDAGKLVFPEGMSKELKFAVTAEIRRRDTQSSYEKAQRKLKTLEAKSLKLEERLLTNVSLDLSDEQREELEELKATDQEAWRNKLNEYEAEAKTKAKGEVDELETLTEAEQEIERREQLLENWLKDNPELDLNDEVIENDLPPRIFKGLEEGKYDFEEFLAKAKEFLTRGTVVKQDEENDDPASKLNKKGGSHEVSDHVVDEDIIESYKEELY